MSTEPGSCSAAAEKFELLQPQEQLLPDLSIQPAEGFTFPFIQNIKEFSALPAALLGRDNSKSGVTQSCWALQGGSPSRDARGAKGILLHAWGVLTPKSASVQFPGVIN